MTLDLIIRRSALLACVAGEMAALGTVAVDSDGDRCGSANCDTP